MKIIESILTKNPCYKIGKKITVKGGVLHSVGCPQPKAKVFVDNWNRSDYDRACVHAFIDGKTGDVYQTLPWNHRGWHSGQGKKGSANDTHFGVEMCEPSTIEYTGGANFICHDYEDSKYIVKKTYKSAVELFAKLCKEYNLDPLEKGVIISHKEAHALGIASNHGDPEHLWKQLGMSYTMDTFRQDVKKAMGAVEPSNTVNDFPATPFMVKVLIDDLNYRTAPSMEGKIKGQTGKGSFTITEVKDGWGKLKSGAGWVWLKNPSYCTINGAVSTTPKKSITEVAKEVIQGKWGNGEERRIALEKAGYNYADVQRTVNALL